MKQPSKSIWGKEDTTQISINEKKIKVDSVFANTFKIALEKIISQTKYTSNTNSPEADGTRYEFITSLAGIGEIAGQTWDGVNGKKLSTLIEIIKLLQEVCKNNSLAKNREIIIAKSKFLLKN